jgi:hypothetical protein
MNNKIKFKKIYLIHNIVFNVNLVLQIFNLPKLLIFYHFLRCFLRYTDNLTRSQAMLPYHVNVISQIF